MTQEDLKPLFNNGITIIKKLKEAGYEAYFVGGCVRDYLRTKPFHDIDITTSAKPKEIRTVFPTSIYTGEKYGTVTVIMGDERIETTTYRLDAPSFDGRHPSGVTYSALVRDDVGRRDFTINGLLMNEDFKTIDLVNGRHDLEEGIIKTIGDPYIRFEEDLLRILRAFYFVSKTGFKIDEETYAAMNEVAPRITTISKERILVELIKMLKSPHLDKAIIALAGSTLKQYLPGLELGIDYFNAHLADERLVASIRPDNFFVSCFVLHGKVEEFYGFSNKHLHNYQVAVELVTKNTYLTVDALFKYGYEICKIAAWSAYILGRDSNRIKDLDYLNDHLPIKSKFELAINGIDIKRILHRGPGQWVGKLLDQLVNRVLHGEIKNEMADLERAVLESDPEHGRQ